MRASTFQWSFFIAQYKPWEKAWRPKAYMLYLNRGCFLFVFFFGKGRGKAHEKHKICKRFCKKEKTIHLFCADHWIIIINIFVFRLTVEIKLCFLSYDDKSKQLNVQFHVRFTCFWAKKKPVVKFAILQHKKNILLHDHSHAIFSFSL